MTLNGSLMRLFGQKSVGRTIFWGDPKRPLPLEQAREHNFLMMGAIGGGKTSVLLVILHDILPHIFSGNGQRAVVYDPKTEFLPHLATMLPEGANGLRILHPRDRRAYAWDIAADIANNEEATGIANTLVPEVRMGGGKAEEFFNNMSRGLVSHTLLNLKSLLGTQWNFRDFVNTMLSPDLRDRIIGLTQEGRDMLADLGSDPTKDNIKSDIRSRFEKFRRLGDFMDYHSRERRKLSLKQWVRSDTVLVLGCDSEPSSLLDDLNRTIMQRLQAILLNAKLNPPQLGDDGRPKLTTTLIIDEFAGFTEKNSLQRLLSLGRSYGLCTLLAFQTRHALVSAFGHEADVKALTSLLGNMMILRLEEPEDAQWAADMLGKHDVTPQVIIDLDCWGRPTGRPKRYGPRQEEHIIQPHEIRALRADGPIRGFARSVIDQDPFAFALHWNKLQRYRNRDESVPAHDFFPDDWQPMPWDRRRIESALAAFRGTDASSPATTDSHRDEQPESVLTSLRCFQGAQTAGTIS